MQTDCWRVLVNKILYHNPTTGYSVFSGNQLEWRPRKRCFTANKDSYVFVGRFACLLHGDQMDMEVQKTFHKKYGTQYQVIWSKRMEPGSLSEIRVLLTKNVKGMTAKRAERVLEKYGLDTISVLCSDPKALDFLSLDPAETARIYESLSQNASFEDTIAFLLQHDIDCRFAMPLHIKYGADAVQKMISNPYGPFLDQIYSFKTAEKIYFSLGKDPKSNSRCLYSTLAALSLDVRQNGNVFVDRENVYSMVVKLLGQPSGSEPADSPFSEAQIESALVELESMGQILSDGSFGRSTVYLTANYEDEQTVSTRVAEISAAPKRTLYREADIEAFILSYQQRTGITLAPGQKQAVVTALTSPLCVISGGPGTGKTQTITAIMAAIRELSPSASIRAAAPTGKAATRITELTGTPASTIHRMLGLGRFDGRLGPDELICDALFIDEFSMADISLCASLLKAFHPGGRLILVGDYNQLPSVGPGLVLRDLMGSELVATAVLTDVFRQAKNSRIIGNAHRIIGQKSETPVKLRISKHPGEDFYFINEANPQKLQKTLVRSVTQMKQKYGYGMESVQILSPVNFGDLGTEHLNSLLQDAFNPSQVVIEFDEKQFRLGDKVVQCENNYELNVFNGEIGIISEITYRDDKALRVSFPDRDIWYPYIALQELELAYALTVHKMQGSESPIVIMPIHELQGRGLSKNLLYTALTRAKKMVILIGSTTAVSEGIRRETTMGRNSNLIPRIRAKHKQRKVC